MFYCSTCAKTNKYPESFFKSRGLCELCGVQSMCNEVAARDLPSRDSREHADERRAKSKAKTKRA